MSHDYDERPDIGFCPRRVSPNTISQINLGETSPNAFC